MLRVGCFVCDAGVVCMSLRWHPRYGVCAFAGIRAMPSCFTRCPCAGRHLLFFAAAKKSRQKKAAHTANISHCLRAPNRSCASHGNLPARVRCQRSNPAHHPLHASALQHAAPDIPRPPRWQTVCLPLVLHTHHSGPIAYACHPVRTESARVSPCKSARLYDATTYTQFATWAAHTVRCRESMYGCLKRVRRSFEALATCGNRNAAV